MLRRRFTVEELEAMVAAGILGEDERIELIGGEVVPMSPKGNSHEVLKTRSSIIGRGVYRARLRLPRETDVPAHAGYLFRTRFYIL